MSSLDELIVGGLYTCDTGLEFDRAALGPEYESTTDVDEVSLARVGTAFVVVKSSAGLVGLLLTVDGEPCPLCLLNKLCDKLRRRPIVE